MSMIDFDKDGGPAFPIANPDHQTFSPGTLAELRRLMSGMSLRDYFAGLAMQAAATNPTGADGFTFGERAEWAYMQADAMLAARKAKP
jgi:hypothetical protein